MASSREKKTVHQRLREAVLEDQGVQLNAEEVRELYLCHDAIALQAFQDDELRVGRDTLDPPPREGLRGRVSPHDDMLPDQPQGGDDADS